MELVKVSCEKGLADLVRRIVTGDPTAEDEIVQRYQRGIAFIIERIVRNPSATEDLSQETFTLTLQKIRRQELRDADRLSGFICSVARNLAIEYVRKQRKMLNHEEIAEAEHVIDPYPGPFDRLLARERAGIALQLLNELKVPRDRQVLFRVYIAEDDKDRICADLGLTRPQLNGVISRASKRYKELYIKRLGCPP